MRTQQNLSRQFALSANAEKKCRSWEKHTCLWNTKHKVRQALWPLSRQQAAPAVLFALYATIPSFYSWRRCGHRFFSCDNLAHIQLAIDPKRRRWEKSTERTILLLKAAKSHTWDVHGTCFKCRYSKHSNVTYDATMDTPRPGAPARPHHWGPWAAHPGHWLAPGRQMTWTVLEDGVQVQYMNSAQN